MSDFSALSSAAQLGNPDTFDVPGRCFLLRVGSKDSSFRVGNVTFLGIAEHS